MQKNRPFLRQVIWALSAKNMSQEELITHILEHWGLDVTKIPETDDKTPDFLAVGEDSSYLIELKTKSPNPELLERREAALSTGELFEEFLPMQRRNRLSGVIRSASTQLNDYDANNSFQIVWLHSEGHSAEAQMDLFEIALYVLQL
jgi:hypothetical protein